MAQMFFSLSGLCSCMFFVLYPFVFGLIRLVGYRVEGCRSSVFFSLPVLILLCLAFSLSRCFALILFSTCSCSSSSLVYFHLFPLILLLLSFFSIFVPLLLLSYYICSFSLPYLLSVLLPSVLAFSPRSHSFA